MGGGPLGPEGEERELSGEQGRLVADLDVTLDPLEVGVATAVPDLDAHRFGLVVAARRILGIAGPEVIEFAVFIVLVMAVPTAVIAVMFGAMLAVTAVLVVAIVLSMIAAVPIVTITAAIAAFGAGGRGAHCHEG